MKRNNPNCFLFLSINIAKASTWAKIYMYVTLYVTQLNLIHANARHKYLEIIPGLRIVYYSTASLLHTCSQLKHKLDSWVQSTSLY